MTSIKLCLLLCLLLTNCSTSTTSNPVDLPGQENPVAQSIDDKFENLGESISGFGGAFMSAKNVINIHIKNYKSKATKKNPFLLRTKLVKSLASTFTNHKFSFSPQKPDEIKINILNAKYDVKELMTWRYLAHTINNSDLSLSDFNEVDNRVTLGLIKGGNKLNVLDQLRKLGVPDKAIAFIEMEIPTPNASLTDRLRPLVPGATLTIGTNRGCSYGFTAKLNGLMGLITASHCSGNPGVENQEKIFQNTNSSDNQVAKKYIDPPWTNTYARCPVNKKCRLGDSAFYAFEPSISGRNSIPVDKIFNETPQGLIKILSAYTDLPNIPLNTNLHKIGYVTGYTSGLSTLTCVSPMNVSSSTNFIPLCLNVYVNPNNVDPISKNGDSGGAVFETTNSGAILHGIHWGNAGGAGAFYTPFAAVIAELGNITDYNYQEPGITVTPPTSNPITQCLDDCAYYRDHECRSLGGTQRRCNAEYVMCRNECQDLETH